MITLTKDGNAIKFTFDDSQHYLQGDGVIEVPVNSLALIQDESNMATFKKAASNDIFISATYDELGMTKSELLQWYKTNMVGETGGGGSGSSITSGDVESMISTALEDYPTNDDLDDALEDYYTTDEIDAAMSSLTVDISGKVDTSAFTESEQVTATALNDLNDRADTIEQVTAIALNDLNDNKADIDNVYEKVSGLTIEFNEDSQAPQISLEKESEGTRYEIIMNDFGFDSYMEMEDGSSYDTNFGQGTIGQIATDHPESGVTSQREFQISTDGFIQTTENSDDNEGYSPYRSESEFNYETGLLMNNTWTEPDQDNVGEFIETSSRVEINNQGFPFIEMEDTEGNVTRIDTYGATINGDNVATEDYVNAAVSGKADTSAVTSSITAAVSGKQDTLVSGTNIKTINNQSLLGSGNITISGGSGGSNIVEVTQAEYDALVSGGTVDPDALYIITDASEINVSGFVQTSAITTAVTSASTDSEIPSAKAVFDAVGQGGGGGSVTVDPTLDSGSTNPVANSAITAAINAKADGIEWDGTGSVLKYVKVRLKSGSRIISSANLNLGDNIIYTSGGLTTSGLAQTSAVTAEIAAAVSGKADTSAVTENEYVVSQAINALNVGKVDTSAITTAVTSASTDSQIASAKCVYDALGGLKFAQVTQAQYDAMVSGGTVDSSTVYFITGSNS